MIKVIYHLLNGETVEVIYENSTKLSKIDFLNKMCQWNNGHFGYFGNEDITKVINLDKVCFFELVELDK